MTVAAAEAAVAAALAADPAVAATVGVGAWDRLPSGAGLLVSATAATVTPWRLVCDISIQGWQRWTTPVAGAAALTALMDAATTTVRAMRHATDGPYWLGPSTPLTVEAVEADDIDAAQWAIRELSSQIAVDTPTQLQRSTGPSESIVRSVLTDAGHPPAESSDQPPIITTRWVGTSAADPALDDITVVAAVDVHDSADLEALARSVTAALTAAPDIAVVAAVDVDPAGIPPGSTAAYAVAATTVRVLRPA